MKCIHVVNYISVPDLSVLGGSGSYIRSDPGGKIYSDLVWDPDPTKFYKPDPDPTKFCNRIRIYFSTRIRPYIWTGSGSTQNTLIRIRIRFQIWWNPVWTSRVKNIKPLAVFIDQSYSKVLIYKLYLFYVERKKSKVNFVKSTLDPDPGCFRGSNPVLLKVRSGSWYFEGSIRIRVKSKRIRIQPSKK